MNKLCMLIIVTLFFFCKPSSENLRQKRQLIYRDKSRFFLRINIKDNVLPYNAIVAQAAGFKVTWDVPHKPYSHGAFFRKRDISNILEDYILRFGFNDYFCILNYICRYLNNDLNNCGFICEMIDFIYRHSIGEKEIFLNKILTKCDEHSNKCDLPQLKLSSFTDLY